MTETTTLRHLLQPELESELATTRRILAVVPDGHGEFKCHEKSMSLAKLAGHVAEMPAFTALLLTSPDLDLGAPGGPPPFVHATNAQTLAAYDAFADTCVCPGLPAPAASTEPRLFCVAVTKFWLS